MSRAKKIELNEISLDVLFKELNEQHTAGHIITVFGSDELISIIVQQLINQYTFTRQITNQYNTSSYDELINKISEIKNGDIIVYNPEVILIDNRDFFYLLNGLGKDKDFLFLYYTSTIIRLSPYVDYIIGIINKKEKDNIIKCIIYHRDLKPFGIINFRQKN